MFKESNFVFEGLEFGSEPDNLPKRPVIEVGAALSENADVVSADFMNPTNQIMTDLFGSNEEQAKLQLGPKFSELYAKSEDMIKAGFAYGGFEVTNDSINLIWKSVDGAKNLSLTSFLDLATVAMVVDMLSEENRDKMEVALEEYSRRMATEFCQPRIAGFLLKNGVKVDEEIFWSSYLVNKEVMPALMAGYKSGHPYVFQPEDGKFTLKSTNKDYQNLTFALSDYDEKLNLIEENSYELAVKYFNEKILPVIKGYRPDLTDIKIKASYMVNSEVMPILIEGLTNKKPYEISSTDKGFSLNCGLLGLHDNKFDFDRYDENLNLKVKVASGVGVPQMDQSLKQDSLENLKGFHYFDDNGDEISKEEADVRLAQIEAEKMAGDALREEYFPDEFKKFKDLEGSFGALDDLSKEQIADSVKEINDRGDQLLADMAAKFPELEHLNKIAKKALESVVGGADFEEVEDSKDLREEMHRLSEAGNSDKRLNAAIKTYGSALESLLEVNSKDFTEILTSTAQE